ncbi:MAG: DnaJ domain-containing protein [Pseudomonadota bacterium]
MGPVWKSVGPILLLQLVVAFLYLAWPWITRLIEIVGRVLGRSIPVPDPKDPQPDQPKQPFRGKWREAAYTSKQSRSDRQERPEPPEPPLSQRELYLRALGLTKPVSKAQLKKTYRKLAKTYHPDQYAAAHHSPIDREKAAEKMLAINEAYDWLVANPRF